MKKLFILMTLVLTSTTSFASLEVEQALNKVNRAQRLLQQASEELEIALSAQTREPLTDNAIASALGTQCRDQIGSTRRTGGVISVQTAQTAIYQNLVAQCRGTRGCNSSSITMSDIAYKFTHDDVLECVVEGTLYY